MKQARFYTKPLLIQKQQQKNIHGKCLVNLPNSVIWRFGCRFYSIGTMNPSAVSTKQQQKQQNELYAATGTK